MKYIKINAPIGQFILITVLLQFMSVAFAIPSGVEARTALVIGNANYHNGPLLNPVNDARAVADSLKKLGFKVLLRENLSREGMLKSVGEFSNLLKEGGVGMFYYAGHGMQINGKNFLIPVDADIKNEDDIEYRSMDANYVLKRMDDAHIRVNLVVLDACRNNPFSRNTRSVSSGLAQMDAPKGTLIAFSTAPNSLANDGLGEKNSVYTRHLVEKLSLPGVLVEQLFKEVRIAVTKETHDKQIPWESSSLTGDFYFVQPSLTAKLIPAQVAPIEKHQVVSAVTRSKAVLEQSPVASTRVSTERKPAKPIQSGRNYMREGYEIEIRAQKLTAGELPTLLAEAEQGDAISQTVLGMAYLLGKGQLDGRGIQSNNPKMLKWIKAAAKQGYAVAQNNLGQLYMEGIGVKTDYIQAQHYFQLAADQNYPIAQSNLLSLNTMLARNPDTKSVH